MRTLSLPMERRGLVKICLFAALALLLVPAGAMSAGAKRHAVRTPRAAAFGRLAAPTLSRPLPQSTPPHVSSSRARHRGPRVRAGRTLHCRPAYVTKPCVALMRRARAIGRRIKAARQRNIHASASRRSHGARQGARARMATTPVYPPSQTVTTAHGDTLTIDTVRPGYQWGTTSFAADYHNSTEWVACFGSPTLYPGDGYAPCAHETFNDVQTGTETTNNDSSVDIEYDACGNVVSSSQGFGWALISSPDRMRSGGYIGGEDDYVNIPPACPGLWTMVYSYTQTFNDGDSATVTVEGTYFVNPAQYVGSTETQGGGNPTETGCTQSCTGDPVNTFSGDYAETITDLSIPGRGPDLAMERTYSSLAAAAGKSSILGSGWAFNYGMSLAVDAASGNVTITEGNGSQTSFASDLNGGYVAPGRVLAKLAHNADGTYTYTVRARTIFTFNSAGKLMAIADLNGEKTTLAYSASGQLATATDGAARTLTFAYNGAQLASVTDSSGRKVLYAYNAAGDLTDVTDVRLGVWSYTYNAAHLMQTRKDARGNLVMTNTYDAAGRTLTQADGLNHQTTFSYNADPSTFTRVTDANNHATDYEYTNGMLMRMTRAAGTAKAATWNYTYDLHGSLGRTSVTDPNNHTSTFTYDDYGNQTGSTDPFGKTTSSSYDTLNDLTGHTDANGNSTSYTFDGKGNMLTESRSLNGTTAQVVTYTHGTAAHPGDVTAVKDPLGNSRTMTYVAATGDLASSTDGVGNKTTYSYNNLGERLTMVSPRGNVRNGTPAQFTTTYTYDAAGNQLTRSDPLGHKTVSTYDKDGNVATVTDPANHVTSYDYDVNNRRTKITRADTSTLQTTYDNVGNPLTQVNAAGKTTSYTYDELDHMLSATDPLNRATNYVFDGIGNVKKVTDAAGRATTYTYDAADRLTNVTYSDGTTPNVAYGYDAGGRRTSMTDGTGSTTYTYDALSRLTKTVNGRGGTTTFGYDIADHQTSLTYPNAKIVTRTYDVAGRTASITDSLGGKTTFAYDADSHLTTTTFPNTSKNVDTSTFNNAGEQTGVSMTKGNTALASVSYARSPLGQVTSDTPVGLPGAAQTYTYNSLNELTQAGTKTYAYDAGSNPTTLASVSGYTYDVANQLTQSPSASYTYNALGERTKVTPAAGTATTYGYDQASRLTSATTSSTTTYAYDGDGLRFSKTVSGTRTDFSWDVSGNLPQLLSDGQVNYVYGPNGLPLEQITNAGVVTYYHHDQLGSTRMLTSSAGVATGTFSYDAYGNLAGSTGTQTTPFGYSGQYTDAETGFLYLRKRYYDPLTGQFLTRDPLGLGGGDQDLYGYGLRDPLNRRDLQGLSALSDFADQYMPKLMEAVNDQDGDEAKDMMFDVGMVIFYQYEMQIAYDTENLEAVYNYTRMYQMSYAQLAQKLGAVAMVAAIFKLKNRTKPQNILMIVENLWKSGVLTLKQPIDYEPDPCDDPAVAA
jgi:RHS repeat-associated protein